MRVESTLMVAQVCRNIANLTGVEGERQAQPGFGDSVQFSAGVADDIGHNRCGAIAESSDGAFL
jgi:hypothetical protein